MEKYVVITGASSGIGAAFANYYAKIGKNLILIARTKDRLIEMKDKLEKKYQVKVVYLISDLSIESASMEIYNRVSEMKVSVEILVNCAGVATNGAVHVVDQEKQHNEIMVNVVALFDLTKLFLTDMIKRDNGQIINVASSSAYHPIPTMAVYAATKAFVLSFSESLSIECKGTGVQVFAISPGATDTNFFSSGGGVAYGKLRSPNQVVNVTIEAMKKNRISKIDGWNNYMTSTFLPRVLTREKMVKVVYNIMKKQLKE